MLLLRSKKGLLKKCQMSVHVALFVLFPGPASSTSSLDGLGHIYTYGLPFHNVQKLINEIHQIIELAEKEHLKIALEQGKIYKSALTADESKNKKNDFRCYSV